MEEPVTFVNAPAIAKARGLEMESGVATESRGHRSTLEVQVVSANGDTATVEGALTSLEHVEKIVRINGRGVDMRAEGRNLFLSYTDQPGALGKVGSQLGEQGINIEAAALTQAVKGDGAFLILRVESEIPEDLEQSIADSIQASSFQLVLD